MPFIKSFFTAFHNINDLLVCRIQINITWCYVNSCFLELYNKYSFGIAKHRDIRIMRGKNKLHIWLLLNNCGYDFVIDYLIIKIIFRLVNKNNIVIVLSQDKQYKRRSSLSDRMLP